AAAVFIMYVFLPFFLVVLLGLPVGAFVLALAFYKINNQPFINIVASAVSYYAKSKLYIWKKIERKPEEIKRVMPAEQKMVLPKITESKLRDLAWSLDVKEKIK
ncbi:MAG: hypothetical protein AAB527_00660, partial [Patescibacteria group bacterium]